MDSAKKTKITALAASHGVNSFYLFFLTPIIPIIAKEFNLNYVEVGGIAALYAFANGIFQFPISFSAERRKCFVFSIFQGKSQMILQKI